ncbi:unnamed protein product [Prunus brigantina]
MASVNPVDSEIGEGFAPPSISSNTGPDTIHLTPFQSNKNNKGPRPAGPRDSRSSARLRPEASIREGFAPIPIVSGTESRAGRVEPEVPESAPAESIPGTSGKNPRMCAVMKKITKCFKLKQKLAR